MVVTIATMHTDTPPLHTVSTMGMIAPMKDEGRTERLVVKVTPEELAAIDAWMFANQIRRGRSEAVRQLIGRGMEGPAPAPEPEPKPTRRRASTTPAPASKAKRRDRAKGAS